MNYITAMFLAALLVACTVVVGDSNHVRQDATLNNDAGIGNTKKDDK